MKWFYKKPKKIGLALGGGGVRGLAHIQVLETFDELGIRPYRIAGTSIGAVLGSLYASGLSGLEVHDLVRQWQVPQPKKRNGILNGHDLRQWSRLLDPSFSRSGLFKGEKIIRFISDFIKCKTFEELEIPLYITAADYGTAAEVVLKSGDLLSAVRASIAIPGVFVPVERDGRLLLDGGVVNPLPCNLLQKECDLVVAVDVGGIRNINESQRPGFFDTVLSGFEIMESALIRNQLKYNPPDIYLKADLRNVGLLEFNKMDQVLEQSASLKEELRRKLKR
jgi:NTE family protein